MLEARRRSRTGGWEARGSFRRSSIIASQRMARCESTSLQEIPRRCDGMRHEMGRWCCHRTRRLGGVRDGRLEAWTDTVGKRGPSSSPYLSVQRNRIMELRVAMTGSTYICGSGRATAQGLGVEPPPSNPRIRKGLAQTRARRPNQRAPLISWYLFLNNPLTRIPLAKPHLRDETGDDSTTAARATASWNASRLLMGLPCALPARASLPRCAACGHCALHVPPYQYSVRKAASDPKIRACK